jgi:hypothetical protein
MFEAAAGNASGSKIIIIKDIVMHRRNCNRVHTRDSSTPKRWSCTRPSVSHLEKYGAQVWIPTEGENLSKVKIKSPKIYTFDVAPTWRKNISAHTRRDPRGTIAS